MRRTAALLTLVVALLAAALSANAVASAVPRGVLTKVEYKQLYASYEALKQSGKERGTPTSVARHTCRALTSATTLTAAEHAECEAGLIYSYRFVLFPYDLERCGKVAASAGKIRCVLGAINTFEKSVRAFIRTNAASVRATAPRGFSRRCLDYLIFTPQQAKTATALSLGLQRYEHAIRAGSSGALSNAGHQLDHDLVASKQAMSFTISVSVCRHQ